MLTVCIVPPGRFRGGSLRYWLACCSAPAQNRAKFRRYVCNGAVIIPGFGDAQADANAKSRLLELFPGRTVVQLNIDPIAAGGSGIHCATQQEPAP